MSKLSPLSDQQAQKLQSLWLRNESALQAMAVYFSVDGSAEEMLCDLGLVLARGQFTKLSDDCTDQDFQRLAFGCLRNIRRQRLTISNGRRKQFVRWVRLSSPKLWKESPVGEMIEQAETVAVVLSHAEELHPTRRDAVVSFYLGEESRSDIAERLGLSRVYLNFSIRQGVEDLRRLAPSSVDPGGMTYEQCTVRMLELRESGLSWRKIACRFGHSYYSIMRRVERFRQAAAEGIA